MTDTAVIVVSYNTRELTLQAVAAARKASAGLDARVLVADNGSTDGTAEAVRAADPEVAVLVNADNPGYGAAVNRAAAGLPSTHVCAMNADVVLEPESLLTLRRFLDANGTCGLVGPALVYADGTPQPSAKPSAGPDGSGYLLAAALPPARENQVQFRLTRLTCGLTSVGTGVRRFPLFGPSNAMPVRQE